MTVKRKLISIIVFVALIILSVSSLFAYTFWSARNHMDVIEVNFKHLFAETKVRALILRQAKESLDIMVARSEKELNEHNRFTAEIKKAIEEWIEMQEMYAHMATDEMSDNLSRARRVYKEYDGYLLDVESALSLVKSGRTREAKRLMRGAIEPELSNILLHDVDLAEESDVARITDLYEKVLQDISVMVFFADEGRRQVQIAKTAMQYYLSVDEMRMNVLKQIKKIIDYQMFSGDEDKNDFVRYGHDASQAIEEWLRSLRTHRSLGLEGEQEDIETGMEVSNLYARFHALSSEALAYIDTGQKIKAMNLVVKGLEHYLDEVLLVYLDRAIEDSKGELERSHAQIRHFARQAGIRLGFGVAILSAVTLLSLIIIIRQMLASIGAIYAGTVKIGAGLLDHRIELRRDDEFGALADAFNSMAESLQRTTISRDYLDNIIMSMHDGLFIIGMDGMVMKVNEAACGMLGYSKEELLAMHVTEILEKGYYEYDEETSNVLRALTGKKEKVLVGINGKKIPVILSSSFMNDRVGAPEALVSIAKDISEIKLSEEHLTHLTQKLISYSKDLEDINEEMRSFTTIVSHDLRAPLRNIHGFSSQLRAAIQDLEGLLEKYRSGMESEDREMMRGILTKEIHEALRYIETSMNRMDTQINAILKLSRLGRRELNSEEIRMDDLVREVSSSLGHQIEKKQVKVRIGKLPVVVADRMSMELIMGNLIDNALKYMEPDREGELEIAGEDQGDEVVFRVKDNGRGIAARDLTKVFEIFKRVGKQDIPGEGMGLAYVKTTVRRLGGRIWCQSREGEGSVFEFNLPKREKGEESDLEPKGMMLRGEAGK